MAKNDSAKKPFGARFWDFFASVKLTFVLLLLLAVVSIAGTVVPQHEAPQAYLTGYGHTLGGLVLAFGLDDAYHTPWFLFLLSSLGLNLIVCSLERLPKVIKIVRKDPALEAARFPKPEQSFTLPDAPEKNLETIGPVLEKTVGRVHRAQEDGALTLFAQKGAWTRFGVYLVHFSVLVIFAGAMVGKIWGFQGFMRITEGQTTGHLDTMAGKHMDLGFSLRLDKFTVSFYPNKMPKEYLSQVVFLKNGAEAMKASIRVNHPAQFEGVDFYQANYGETVDLVKVRLIRNGKTFETALPYQKWADLPQGGQAGVMEYRGHVQMGSMYHGPLARILFRADGKSNPEQLTAFAPGAKMPARGPLKFEILDARSKKYSGLSVKYDPGVWFIWVGCTMMVFGFFIAFYMSHRKVWIRLSPSGKDQGRTKVELAGSANKNRLAMKRILERMAEDLKPQDLRGEKDRG